MKFFTFLSFIFIALNSFTQNKGILAGQYTHFELTGKKDTIDFVVADTSLTETKPVLLFCQGSQPVPLFLTFESYGIVPIALSNFDLETMKKHYHVVVISMPKTPLVVGQDHLNASFHYVTDTSDQVSYASEYLEADYLENYVDRGNKVIRYLRKQSWVDKENIVVCGHSQGARVAVAIAASNKRVTKLGLFGYNPMRRIDQVVWSYRKQAQNGQITWEKADSLQQEQYEFYQLLQDQDAVEKDNGLKTWASFSTSSISELSRLKIPVYIAFGSADEIAEYCDLLPLYFAETNKVDYVLRRYPNLEHNFFPLDENGRPVYKEGKWKEVMNAFINWSKNT